jgi:deoxyribodipyrimidine photo-lyase
LELIIPSELKTVASFTAETNNQFQNLTHNQTQGLTTQLNKNIQSSQDLTPNQTQDTSPNTAIYIYNYYNLDPLWHKDQPGQRILLLEPDFFQQYPISDKCWNFMMQLAAEILINSIRYKEHPLNIGYQGVCEARDWIAPTVQGYYPSFFAYWKAVKRVLDKY